MNSSRRSNGKQTQKEKQRRNARVGKDTGNVGTRDKGCRGIWRYQNFRCFSITITSGRCEYAATRTATSSYLNTSRRRTVYRWHAFPRSLLLLPKKKKKQKKGEKKGRDTIDEATNVDERCSHDEIRSRVTLRDGDIETRRGRKGRRTGSRVSGRNGTGKQSDIVY